MASLVLERITAIANAKRTLKPGDRIRAVRCMGIKRTYTFDGWDGNWIVSKSGVDDIAPEHIDLLNGAPVDFKRATAD